MTARTKTLAPNHRVSVRLGSGPYTQDTTITLQTGDSLLINGQVVEPPPQPVSKIVTFPANGTKTALSGLLADETVDVVEMAGGGRTWSDFRVAVKRTRPVVVRPAPGERVLFDGGGSSSPAFRFGWDTSGARGYASNVLFDAMGLGGRFEFANYQVYNAGLIMARAFDHCGFNDFDVHDVIGTGPAAQNSHVVYLDHEEGLLPKGLYWQSNRVKIVGPTNRWLSGLHIYHEPPPDHIEATDWTVENLHRWVYAANDLTDLTVARWTGVNCNATIDNAPNKAQGVVKDCHATNCGPLAPGKGYWLVGQLVDGGGNTYV